MKGALLVSVETIRSRLQALSDATAPTPRSKAKPKESEPSDLDMMLQYYGGTLPSTLRYNAPPPSYDALYGPDPNKPVSKREAMKAIAKTVARELVGGK
ncbi:hypothetical protein FRB97_004455 [Tulasnella sp. 331]|nr:hypothetical protein FRB97_004455 [Tulasnella sp. 331]KAG8881677.1 hypothetical protein FRB98_004206 [Tulasnella sp. 332]